MTEVIFFTPGYPDKHLRQLPVCSDKINQLKWVRFILVLGLGCGIVSLRSCIVEGLQSKALLPKGDYKT